MRHIIRVEDVKNALIFCNRKRDVDILFRSLTKHGFDVVQLHGDMPQSARTETLERFKRNEVRLMVCSDVAARGLDISDLSHVFNFDVPNHSEDYVHRIGRTGRAGKEGRAFTIATAEEGKAWAAITKLIGKEIPRFPIEGLPEIELDPNASPRRGGRGAERSSRSPRGKEAPPRRERAPRNAPAEVVAAPADHVVERLAEPVSREQPQVQPQQPRQQSVRQQPYRDRDAQRNDAPPREQVREQPRDQDNQRNNRDYRDNRRDRNYRGRRDEYGIGEMNHPDNVVGFGSHVPDFIMIEVVLPAPVEKRTRSRKADNDEVAEDFDGSQDEADSADDEADDIGNASNDDSDRDSVEDAVSTDEQNRND